MNSLGNCYTKLVTRNGICYAFDTLNYKILKLDPDEEAVFRHLIEYKQFPGEARLSKAIFKIMMLIKKGYYFSEQAVQVKPAVEKNKYIISFPIVHACNMRCKYCFADGGQVYKGTHKLMSQDVLKRIIPFLQEQSQNELKSIRLEFVSGGETLLLKDKYKENVDFLKDEARKQKLEFQVFTVTNGTVLDEEIIDYINKNNIDLGISIDGEKQVHDYQRVFADGSGTYDTIRKNIEQFMQSKQEQNLWVVSVVTSHTDSLVDIMRHNLSLHTKTAEMRVVRGKDKYGLALSKDNLEHFIKLYDELIDYLKDNLDDVKIILNRYDTLGKLIVRLFTGQWIVYRCQAGKSKFSFTADGDIYPCDSFVGEEQYKMGNLLTGEFDGKLALQFKENSVINNPTCSACPYEYLCGGDCYYNAYKVEESGEQDVFCKLQSHLCELAIDFVGYLEEKDPEKQKELKRFARIRELN